MDRFKLPVLTCGTFTSKDYSKIRKSICAGFFTHASRKDPQEGYRTVVDN